MDDGRAAAAEAVAEAEEFDSGRSVRRGERDWSAPDRPSAPPPPYMEEGIEGME